VTTMLDTPAAIVRTAPTGVHRLLLGGTTTLDGHVRCYGPLPALDRRRIRAAVAAAGLTGRGGAGFPTHRKLEAVASAGHAVVVANGAEGEPASSKDHVLLTYAPHLVLDGLQLAAVAVGADAAHIVVPSTAESSVRAALRDRRDAVKVTVHAAPGTFVAGEESAVVSAVNGGPAVPRDKGVRVLERGVRGRPTLVQNVETLAHMALIARYGPDWFRAAGTLAEPGTFLATLSGPVAAPGVYEFGYGIPVGSMLAAAGGATEPLQALLVGGYHGAWIPADTGIAISRGGLDRYGASPGAGIVVPLPVRSCGLTASARILTYLAGQSARQCGPCVNGLPRLAETFAGLAGRRPHPAQLAEVERLSRLVDGRGACKHPDGTVRFIRSSLRMFAPDVRAHLAGWCIAETALAAAGAGGSGGIR
jgi:NADH:ubiquinone oxidoreductase subunit F (NADH-binding)